MPPRTVGLTLSRVQPCRAAAAAMPRITARPTPLSTATTATPSRFRWSALFMPGMIPPHRRPEQPGLEHLKSPSPFLPDFSKLRLRGVTNPREGNHLRHACPDLLFAALLRVMCGYDSYRAFARFGTHVEKDWTAQDGTGAGLCRS